MVTVLSPSSPKSNPLDSPVTFAGVESINVLKSSCLNKGEPFPSKK